MRTAVAGDHSASWRTPWEPRLHAPGEPLLAVDRAVPVNNFGTEVTLRPGSPTRPGGKARDTGRRGTGRNPRDQRPRGNHKRKGGGRLRHVFVLSLKVDVSARTGHTHRGRDNAQARPRGTPGAPLGTPSSAALRVLGATPKLRSACLAALPGEGGVLCGDWLRLACVGHPVEHSAVAPHHLGVVVRVDLQQQVPSQRRIVVGSS